MNIIGPDYLVFGVDDLPGSIEYLTKFGLKPVDVDASGGLFEALETKETMLRMLDATGRGDGVQIFIGSDNPLFANTGCSMVVAPFRDSQERILGAIGVIGPTRLNYARIIPLVDYTARAIGRMVS